MSTTATTTNKKRRGAPSTVDDDVVGPSSAFPVGSVTKKRRGPAKSTVVPAGTSTVPAGPSTAPSTEEQPQKKKRVRRTYAQIRADEERARLLAEENQEIMREVERRRVARIEAEKEARRTAPRSAEDPEDNEGNVADEEAFGATYNEMRKPARVAPDEDKLTAADFNDSSKLQEWYSRLGLAVGTVKTSMSNWNRILEWNANYNDTFKKNLKPLEFIKTKIEYIMDRIKNHNTWKTGTKKGLTGFLIQLIDLYPLLRKDQHFIESEDVRQLRVYNNLLKFKSSELAEARGSSLFYPLNKEVDERIQAVLPEEELRVFAMTMRELPLRNDLVLVAVHREEDMKDPKQNYVLIPRDETKPVQIKINVFKTSNFADRYTTLHNCTETLSTAIRAFHDRKFEGAKFGRKFLFRDNKNGMASINKLVIERLGYTYLDGGKR